MVMPGTRRNISKQSAVRKKLLIFAGLVLAILLAIWLMRPAPPDPVYNGKALSYWLINSMVGVNPNRSNGATCRLLSCEGGVVGNQDLTTNFPVFDSQAVPYLRAILRSKSWSVKGLYYSLREESPAFAKHVLPAPRSLPPDPSKAAVALGSLGTNAQSAAADLATLAAKSDTPAPLCASNVSGLWVKSSNRTIRCSMLCEGSHLHQRRGLLQPSALQQSQRHVERRQRGAAKTHPPACRRQSPVTPARQSYFTPLRRARP